MPLSKDDELQFVSNSPNWSFGSTILLPKHGSKEATRVAEAGRKLQEEAREIVQDVRLTYMAKCLFEQP